MDPERWRRLRRLIEAALELPEPEQRAFLQRKCAEDPMLEREAAALLEADRKPGFDPPSGEHTWLGEEPTR